MTVLLMLTLRSQRYNRLYNKQNDILMVLLKIQIFLREYFLTIKDVVEFL